MIQDIAPHHLYNEFTPRDPKADDLIFAFNDRKLLASLTPEGCHFPTWEMIASHLPENVQPIWLFSLDEISCFLIMDQELSLSDSFAYYSLRQIRGQQPKHEVFAAFTAYHLYTWYQSNQFCGRCGTPVVHSTKERMVACPNCGNTIYPKICPAIIVGVIDGERILLTKYAAGRNNPNYALIAGFTEIGETAEETVIREVQEEVGLKVKNIHYYKTQPWGLACDLLLGFYAELDGEDTITLDQEELSTGVWMDRNDIHMEDEDFSLTREMIVHFVKEGRKVLHE